MTPVRRAVVHVGGGASRRIAGLSVLERLVVALHRAGVTQIDLVAAGKVPEFRRLVTLRIAVGSLEAVPEDGEFFYADGALFVSLADVAAVVSAEGRLVDREGRALPLELRRGGRPTDATVTARNPAFVIAGDADRERAKELLWQGLGSSADGLVDRYLNRPIGRVFSKLLLHTPVTPNQVTLFGAAVGLCGAAVLAQPGPWTALAGALLFQLASAIDCVDGELARVRFQESAFGRWLDLGLDQLVHLAIFVAVGVHCARIDDGTPALALGLSAALGGLLSFAAVVYVSRTPAEHGSALRAKLVDWLATRDFSIVLILFAATGRLSWFLWLAGTLSHLFWIALLVLGNTAPAGKSGGRLRARLGTVIAVAAGISLFAWTARSAGTEAVLAQLAGLGWLALLVPLPQLLAFVPDTLGWKYAFRRHADRLRFSSLYAIRLAGEGINYVTPTAYVGGEAVKVYLLIRRGAAALDAVASAVVAKTAMTLAEMLFLALGALCVLQTLPANSEVFRGLAVVVTGGTALVGLIVWMQLRGGVARQLERRSWAAPALVDKIAAFEREVGLFYREAPSRFVHSTAHHLVGWVTGAAELFFHSAWLGAPIGIADAIAISAAVTTVKGVTFFVPGSVGFQESGFVFLYALFGLPPEAGVGVGILRRGRELACGLFSVAFLVYEEGSFAAFRRSVGALSAGDLRTERDPAPPPAVRRRA